MFYRKIPILNVSICSEFFGKKSLFRGKTEKRAAKGSGARMSKNGFVFWHKSQKSFTFFIQVDLLKLFLCNLKYCVVGILR